MTLTDERKTVMELVQAACDAGARKTKACELLGLSVRTLERWEKSPALDDKRSLRQITPHNKLTSQEHALILITANSEKYRDMPPCKIVPLLADEGMYIASESSFYRVLRDANQLMHRGNSKPSTHHKPKTFVATGPRQVFSWDISYLPTQVAGFYVYLYLIMDIYSRKIVGFSVHEKESSAYAALLMEQTCRDENIQPHQVVLHSDNGAPMKGVTMLAMLEKLGVLPSFSRPSVSDDNPYSEALFKTLKYHPTFPALTKFATIEAARKWCEQFVAWYNYQHLHSGLKFITPHQRHSGEDKAILMHRHAVYEQAKKRHPKRWSRHTRDWVLADTVSLNPNKKINQPPIANATVLCAPRMAQTTVADKLRTQRVSMENLKLCAGI